MEPIIEALRLLKRQAEIQNDLRRARGSRVTEERELFLIRNKLAQFPAAVQAIGIAAAELHRPVDTLSPRDVERCV
jgi:ubiquinone biosynthesis protein UbiJ